MEVMIGKQRYCDHCGEYVCKSTYFEHLLAGAYEHVGSTEVDDGIHQRW